MPNLHLSMLFGSKKVLFPAFLIAIILLSPRNGMAQEAGCTDPLASNFDDSAEINDGSCTYPGTVINFENRVQLPSEIAESSGLIYWNNTFWTHNDDTDLNLYGFSFENVNELELLPLNGLTNVDWEEIRQDDNYLYIGDIGNNAGNRTDLKIYKILKSSIESGNPEVETIAFSYEDQEDFNPPGNNETDFDSEAFIVTDDRIYIFTKEWVSRNTTIYEIPNEPGEHVAINRNTLDLNAMVTGAVYLEDERLIALIGYNFPDIAPTFIYLLYDFQGDDFFGGNKRMLVLSLGSFVGHQVEAITTINGLTYYATNEFASNGSITIPQRMHEIELTEFLSLYINDLGAPERYYYKGSGAFNDAESWATNPNGSGRSVADFSFDNTEYIIGAGGSYVVDYDWEISGENVSITLGNEDNIPVSLTLNSEVNAKVNVRSNAEFTVDNTTVPELGELESGSSVHLMNISDLTIPEATYFDLTIENSTVVSPDEDQFITVNGSLVFEDNPSTDLSAYALTFAGDEVQLLNSDLPLNLRELTIDKNGGTLEITESTDIRIHRLFILEAGNLENNGSLTLESGGIFMNNTSNEPEITFERLVSAPVFSDEIDEHWVALSSPVTGTFAGETGLLNSVWTQGFSGSNDAGAEVSTVFELNNGVWQAPSSNNLTTGKGFFVQLFEEQNPGETGNPVDYSIPFSISGMQNSFDGGQYEFTDLFFDPDGNGISWNLLGNPFASALDWSAEGTNTWGKNGTGDFIYFWNPLNRMYQIAGKSGLPSSFSGLISVEPIIAPFQPFWIFTVDENVSLVVGENARSSENTNSDMFATPDEQPAIALQLNEEAVTAFRFDDDFTSANQQFDAPYLPPFGESYYYMYACQQDYATILRSLPLPSDEPFEIGLSLGFKTVAEASENESTLHWPVFENIPENWDITLTDTQEAITVDLKSNESYTFTFTSETKEEGIVFNQLDCPASLSEHRFIFTVSPDFTSTPKPGNDLPGFVSLDQNYPNPFNPVTQIQYHLPEATLVDVSVYDVLGKQVASLVSEQKPAGTHTVSFDASKLSSGVYMYVLKTKNAHLVRKMSVVK